MLHQFWCGARDHDARSFRGSFHAGNHHTHTLGDGKRFQSRLFLARHASFRLADIENYIRAFDALHCGVDDLSDAPDVFVVNRVPLRFAHLLENHLLRQLRRDASQNSFGHFRNLEFAADFERRINLARIFQRDLQVGIFHLLRSLHHGLHRKGVDLAGFLIELGPQIFLRLVVLARSHDNGVFHRADYNLRINAFFPAECVDRVVKLACHKNQFSVASGQLPVRARAGHSPLVTALRFPAPSWPSPHWRNQFLSSRQPPRPSSCATCGWPRSSRA